MIENTGLRHGALALEARTSGDGDEFPITDEMIDAGIEALEELDLALTSRTLVSRVYQAMVLARESSKTRAIFRGE